MIRRVVLVVAVVASLAFGEAARGQHWTQLTEPQNHNQFLWQTPYFLNKDVGFAFIPGIIVSNTFHLDGPSHLQMTTDGGQNWSSISFFDSIHCVVAQLCFESLQQGYAATFSLDTTAPSKSGIFETTDMGQSWHRITPAGLEFSGVYVSHDVIFASKITTLDSEIRSHEPYKRINDSTIQVNSISGPILISRDHGVHWDSITHVDGLTLSSMPQFEWIYGNRDSLIATVYFDNIVGHILTSGNNVGPPFNATTHLVYTTDLGQHWKSELLDTVYPDPVAVLQISPHSCNVVREFDNDSLGNADVYAFLKSSSPDYAEWDTLLTDETSAWAAGNSCAIYVPYAGGTGIYQPARVERSTDQGRSWQGITDSGGIFLGFFEMDDFDCPVLSVVGHGAVVYASSLVKGLNGRYTTALWKTTDGGDGTLSATALAPKMALAHSPFRSGLDTLDISSCATSQMILTNLNIGCSYATFDSLTITGLDPEEYSITSTHYCSCTHLPDTSIIMLNPAQLGIRNLIVHFHFTDDEFNQIDTSIKVTLHVKPNIGVPMSLTLASGPFTTHGDTIDIPVLMGDNLPALLSAPVHMSLPITLDTNVLHPFEFIPSIPGIMLADSLRMNTNGIDIELQSLRGISVNGQMIVGMLRCIFYLTDTLETSAMIVGASINTGDGDCVGIEQESVPITIALTGCGDSTLLRFMQKGLISLAILSVRPNPASNSVDVDFVNPTSSAISYQVMDALGIVRMEGTTNGSALTLDVHSLAAGIYYVRARNAAGSSTAWKFLVSR